MPVFDTASKIKLLENSLECLDLAPWNMNTTSGGIRFSPISLGYGVKRGLFTRVVSNVEITFTIKVDKLTNFNLTDVPDQKIDSNLLFGIGYAGTPAIQSGNGRYLSFTQLAGQGDSTLTLGMTDGLDRDHTLECGIPFLIGTEHQIRMVKQNKDLVVYIDEQMFCRPYTLTKTSDQAFWMIYQLPGIYKKQASGLNATMSGFMIVNK